MIHSCLVWFPWWLRHGAMEPLRQPSSGWVMTVLNSEFTHFNLVIRLSKVKQSALLFFTVYDVPLFRLSFANSSGIQFFECGAVRNIQKPPSSQQLLQSHYKRPNAGRYTIFRCGFLSFDGLWWGETYCASNPMELESRFMPIGARPDHGPGVAQRKTYRFRSWILLFY